MKLFSYIVVYDSGFSPNPFWKYCTLACCKPSIRRTAEKGDWIVGLSKKSFGNKLIYAMEVTEQPLTYEAYYKDKRFENKIPDMNKKEEIYKRGDNIYKPDGKGHYIQLYSSHSNKDGSENQETKENDLKGKNVLISDNFYYFGSGMLMLPEKLKFLIVGRGYKCRFDEEQINTFLNFIKKQKKGILDHPSYKWNSDDESWRRFS